MHNVTSVIEISFCMNTNVCCKLLDRLHCTYLTFLFCRVKIGPKEKRLKYFNVEKGKSLEAEAYQSSLKSR